MVEVLYVLGGLAFALVIALVVWSSRWRNMTPVALWIGLLLFAAGAVGVGSAAWLQSRGDQLPDKVSTPPPAESSAGKNNSTSNQTEAGRTRDILKTTGKAQLSNEQRDKIHELLTHDHTQPTDIKFPLTIGAGVPQQMPLHDIPTDVADVLRGYNGDKYLLTQSQFVIVDAEVRRVVAIYPIPD